MNKCPSHTPVVVNENDDGELEKNTPIITIIDTVEKLNMFQEQIQEMKFISFDAEGVNLSRNGSITLITIGLQLDNGISHIFLFDLLNQIILLQTLQVLKFIIEDSEISKIIHDCRQDSDALSNLFNIQLANVFDTSIYGMKIRYMPKRDNLNNTLAYFGCNINKNRCQDYDLYAKNPNFWTQRPLTDKMIQYASQDVIHLFQLRDKMINQISSPPATTTSTTTSTINHRFHEIELLSQQAPNEFRSCPFSETIFVPKSKLGLIIGKGGSNIIHIQNVTDTFISSKNDLGFLVLATSQSKLDKAKVMIHRCLLKVNE